MDELIKPAFYFGPTLTMDRIRRKRFLPHLSTRFQYVWRQAQNDRDISKFYYRIDKCTCGDHGRIFLEGDDDNFRTLFPKLTPTIEQN